jgi:acyl dehydratase
VSVAAPPRFFFEDVELHGIRETPAITVTEAHVALYGGLTGDVPPEAGVAPSLLLLCLTTGLGWRMPQPPLAVLAFMGVEWHVDAQLQVGDTIHSRSKTTVKRAMREGGVIIEERQVINQRGETVQHGKFTFLVAKRPARTAGQGDSA